MKKLNIILVNILFSIMVYGQPLNINIDDYTAVPSENFCLQFEVSNFDQIISSQYTIQWDPNVIYFDSLTANGMPIPDNLFYNTAFIDMGQLLINWFDSFGNGNDLPDGSVMYELCYTAVGPVGSSTTLIFTDLPLQIEVTSVSSGGTDIGIDYSGGTVTIVAPLESVNTVLTQPDCNNPDVGSIDIMMTGGVAPYTYSWTGPGTFSETTEDIFNLSSGTYYLSVTDSSDPAIQYLDTFLIDAMLEVPVATIDNPATITCTDSLVTLDASGSSQGVNYELIWLTTNGNIILNGNTLNPVVDAPGDYQLTITNTDNGCTSTVTTTVVEDTEAPTAAAGEDGHIDCVDIVYIMDGSQASSSGPEFTATWNTANGNILTGENTFIATVNGSGTYNLIVTDQSNGCTATDMVMVTLDTIHPFADAGMDQTQTCFNNLMILDGSDSSTGGAYTYAWTTDDGNILGDTAALMIQVDEPGAYNLAVTNLDNGCTTNDLTMIMLDEDLLGAMAGADENLCEDSFQMNANLPANNTGVWTYSGSAQLADTLLNNTMVSTLAGGINEFIWTLSTADCPAYSSDTIVLTLEDIPTANEDMFVIPFGENPSLLDLTANDGILTVSGFTLDIISNPEVGSLTELPDNVFEFSYPDAYFGMLDFEYSLCNSFCPDYCDTTMVLLDVLDQMRIDTTVEIPNGITPNNDGINDTFEIPVLADSPEDFPDSEMIIFNRWGNIVYEAKPYLNDWGGTNTSGNQLPQGTYYYVLRLDLTQGLIIKGDVTILR